jgi:hypothetical protein
MPNWSRKYITIIHMTDGELAHAGSIFRETEQHNERLSTVNVPLSVNITELRGNIDDILGMHTSADNFSKWTYTVALTSGNSDL